MCNLMSDNTGTRRQVLKRGVQTAIAGGLVTASSSNAMASQYGNCTESVDGDVIKISEFNGNDLDYRLGTINGQWVDCYSGSTESNDDIGTTEIFGTVNGGSDKYVLSGGGLANIQLHDNGGDASVAVEVSLGPDHCAANYNDYAKIWVEEKDGNRASYDFCTTVAGIDGYDDLESNDETYSGSCAQGYVRNGQDTYTTYGRLQSLTSSVNGGTLVLNRRPRYSEC